MGRGARWLLVILAWLLVSGAVELVRDATRPTVEVIEPAPPALPGVAVVD